LLEGMTRHGGTAQRELRSIDDRGSSPFGVVRLLACAPDCMLNAIGRLRHGNFSP
jgi:hypothetical protein